MIQLTRKVRRIAVLLLAVLVSVGGASAWYWLRPSSTPSLPPLDLTGVELKDALVIEDARKLVESQPRLPQAWGHLGAILWAREFFGQAKYCLACAEKLDPKDARWPYFQGLILSGSNPEEGEACFRRAFEHEPANRTLEAKLAEQLLAQGKLQEAEDHFREILKAEPDNARAFLGLGMTLLQKGDASASVPYLRKLASGRASPRAANVALAAAYERLHDSAAARKAEELATRLPQDAMWPDTYLHSLRHEAAALEAPILANAILDAGQPAKAIPLLEQATKFRPDYEEAYLPLARAYVETGRDQDAEKILRRLLDKTPSDYNAVYWLARALAVRKNYRGAVDGLHKAIGLRPEFAEAHMELARCLLALDDRAGALEAYRAALRYRPDLLDAHLRAAELLARESRPAEARDHLRQAVLLSPDDPQVVALRKKLSGTH